MKLKEALLEITQKCNLSCKHCYAGKTAPDLKTEQWIKILNKLKKMGIKRVVLLGGEPTLYLGFYELLQYSIDNFDIVTVETNGTTPTTLNAYECVVSISIEYANAEKNDEIRGKGSFELALRKLQTISNPKILRYTIYSDSDPLAMAYLAERVGANSVGVSLKPIGLGAELKSKVPSGKMLLNWYKDITMFNNHSKFTHKIDDVGFYIVNPELYDMYAHVFIERKRICSAGCFRIFVSATGEVSPCPFLQKFKMGNILKNRNGTIIKNLDKWNRGVINAPIEGKCSTCKFLPVCGGGGCTAVWIDNKVKNGIGCAIGR